MEILSLALAAQNGDCDALSAYIELKRIEDELNNALKIVQPLAINEADKYAGKQFSAFGAIIEKKSAPATYKYSGSVLKLQEKLKAWQEKAKVGTFVDEESGEIIEKAVKIEGKSTIAVKLQKEPV